MAQGTKFCQMLEVVNGVELREACLASVVDELREIPFNIVGIIKSAVVELVDQT